MRSYWPMVVMAGLGVAPMPLAAQEPKPEDPVHAELRVLRGQLVDAVNKNDITALISLLEKNVVVTWMNGEVSRGPGGVRAYYDRMMKGDKRIVESVTISTVHDSSRRCRRAGVLLT